MSTNLVRCITHLLGNSQVAALQWESKVSIEASGPRIITDASWETDLAADKIGVCLAEEWLVSLENGISSSMLLRIEW